jgi:hypothetical protein
MIYVGKWGIPKKVYPTKEKKKKKCIPRKYDGYGEALLFTNNFRNPGRTN